jgi:hypothetical protein
MGAHMTPMHTVSRIVFAPAGALILAATWCSPALAADQGVPLSSVIQRTVQVLDAYQQNANGGSQPSLVSADFDFKAVVDKQVGGGVNFLFFVLKASRTTETATDVAFSYKLPPAKASIQAQGLPMNDALLKTIQAAAQAVTEVPEFKSGSKTYNFCQLTATVAFSVKYDGNGGVTAPFQLVTVSLTGDVNSNNAQQVKLTFQNPTPGKC